MDDEDVIAAVAFPYSMANEEIEIREILCKHKDMTVTHNCLKASYVVRLTEQAKC